MKRTIFRFILYCSSFLTKNYPIVYCSLVNKGHGTRPTHFTAEKEIDSRFSDLKYMWYIW